MKRKINSKHCGIAAALGKFSGRQKKAIFGKKQLTHLYLWRDAI
jgi:hypothetical protein